MALPICSTSIIITFNNYANLNRLNPRACLSVRGPMG
jgi:hypothetical protein